MCVETGGVVIPVVIRGDLLEPRERVLPGLLGPAEKLLPPVQVAEGFTVSLYRDSHFA